MHTKHRFLFLVSMEIGILSCLWHAERLFLFPFLLYVQGLTTSSPSTLRTSSFATRWWCSGRRWSRTTRTRASTSKYVLFPQIPYPSYCIFGRLLVAFQLSFPIPLPSYCTFAHVSLQRLYFMHFWTMQNR